MGVNKSCWPVKDFPLSKTSVLLKILKNINSQMQNYGLALSR